MLFYSLNQKLILDFEFYKIFKIKLIIILVLEIKAVNKSITLSPTASTTAHKHLLEAS